MMVVIAIIGDLSSVTLPAQTSAQDRAKSSAARQESLNTAKTCTITLIGGVSQEVTAAGVTLVTVGDMTNLTTACTDDAE